MALNLSPWYISISLSMGRQSARVARPTLLAPIEEPVLGAQPCPHIRATRWCPFAPQWRDRVRAARKSPGWRGPSERQAPLRGRQALFRAGRRGSLDRLARQVHFVAGEPDLALEHATAHTRLASRALYALTDAIKIVGTAPGAHVRREFMTAVRSTAPP